MGIDRTAKRRWPCGHELITALGVGIVVMCPPPLAPPWVSAEGLKVAFVNVGEVFDSYQRTKVSEAELEKTGRQKESELQGRLNELKKMRESLELLSDQSREAKAREIEQKSDDLQRFRTASTRELRRERQRIITEILGEVRQAVEEYAKAHGFSLVVDGREVLYGDVAYDISDEVLQLLNRRYTTKGR